MREIAGAIVILAGAVLYAAGILADAVNKGHGGHGISGYALGVLFGLVGFVLLCAGAVKRFWDSLPTEEKISASASRPRDQAPPPQE